MLDKIEVVGLSHVETILDSIAEKLRQVAKEVYVFGSVKGGWAIHGEADLDLLIVPRRRISHAALWRLLDEEVTALLEAGLSPHMIIYQRRGMQSLLEDVRKSGHRLL